MSCKTVSFTVSFFFFAENVDSAISILARTVCRKEHTVVIYQVRMSGFICCINLVVFCWVSFSIFGMLLIEKIDGLPELRELGVFDIGRALT